MSKKPLVDPNLGPDEKLTAYMRLHRDLTLRKNEVGRRLQVAQREVNDITKEIHRVGTAISHLKHGGQTPLVTDHAIVRYLERVEGRDIDEIRLAIAKYSHSVKQGNVFVTVNGTDLEAKS